MARMRTIKPEFWDSPSTAQADLAVRLTYLAMWNWADDSGHGTANLKELEAFAFPNDEVTELPRKSRGNSAGSSGTWRNFSEILGEVAEAYGVVFYRVNGRPYYSIPSFRKHQSKDFREKSRYPKVHEGEIFDVTTGNAIGDTPKDQPQDEPDSQPSAGSSGNSAHTSGETGLVIGEQGNRVTGDITSDSANAEPRPDIESVLDRIDQHCAEHDFKKPNRTKQNLNAARLMLDKDERTLEQVNWIMDWVTAHHFWASNIMSASKLREKFDQLKGQALSNRQPAQHMTASQRRLQEGYEREQRILNGELSFDNPDNPYLQPRPPRQAIEGGNPWTTEQP